MGVFACELKFVCWKYKGQGTMYSGKSKPLSDCNKLHACMYMLCYNPWESSDLLQLEQDSTIKNGARSLGSRNLYISTFHALFLTKIY